MQAGPSCAPWAIPCEAAHGAYKHTGMSLPFLLWAGVWGTLTWGQGWLSDCRL